MQLRRTAVFLTYIAAPDTALSWRTYKRTTFPPSLAPWVRIPTQAIPSSVFHRFSSILSAIMKLSTFIVFAVATSAASISDPINSNALEKRKCFKTGAEYGNQKGEAWEAVREVCKNEFQGTYYKGWKFTRCRNIAGKKSVKFTVGLTGPNAGAKRFLGEEECYSGLHKEVKNCGRGGETTYGNWYYR